MELSSDLRKCMLEQTVVSLGLKSGRQTCKGLVKDVNQSTVVFHEEQPLNRIRKIVVTQVEEVITEGE